MRRSALSFCAMGLAVLASLPAVPVAAQQEPAVQPEKWPAPTWPRPRDPAVEQRIADLIDRMTLEEKVGQVIQADIASVTPEEVRRYHLGSILNGGNSGPGGNDLAPPAKWLELADEMWTASVDRTGGRTGVPVLWGTDAVHGHSNIVGATLFPHNIGLGAANDPDLIERIGRATAIEIRTTGQEWTFAPTLTVPQDYRWGRAYEGYSSDPALVSLYADRMVRGLQGEPGNTPLLDGPHVLASTKHFIADGGTTEGRDQGDAAISEDDLRRVHGAPYQQAISAGVGTIMTSFSSWQGTKIAGHKGLVTDVLKKRMNFDGFVVTDWNAHGQIAGCTNASCPRAINAGVDMYMAPDTWRALYDSLLAQAKDGTVPIAQLDEAVRRVLRVKAWIGLLDAPKPSERAFSGRFELLGAPDHRALAREAVAKSLVLLKRRDAVLPLRPGGRILVVGEAADDIARQSGGWTLSWQGTGLTNAHFPGATSIWSAIADAARQGGGTATLAPDGRWQGPKPDVAVVVFGETPYAEFQGDLKALQLRPELRGHVEVMRRLKSAGIPIVAVMLTGRPLFINPELNLADALVVAWLPGSEGAGVADGLFGRTPFTGRLPADWPLTAQADGPVLFRRGFGPAPAATWRPLPEASGVAETGAVGVFFDAGRPSPSWSFQISDATGNSTRVTQVPTVAPDSRVQVTAVDHLRQEDARRVAMAGGAAQIVELTTQMPVDLSRETNGDVMLVLTIRVEQPSSAPVQSLVGCGTGCGAAVPLPELSQPSPKGWQRIGIPLKCFARAGADMSRIDAPFRIATAGALTFSLSRVALGTDADVISTCGDRPK